VSGRALVTGAGGFVGAYLVARLAGDGWEVVATVRPGAPPWRLAALRVPDEAVEVVAVDLTDADAVGRAVVDARPDVAFHLAAARAAGDAAARAATAAVNTMSGLHVVDALPASCRAVVRLGSSTEYAEAPGPMDESTPLRPRGFFGGTKAAGSLLVAATAGARGLRSAILRAFQVYGPLDHETRFVPAVLRAARDATPLPLTAPGHRRDWVHVDDVVEGCVLAAGADDLPPGQVLNIGTGRQVANEELVSLAERATGRAIRSVVGAEPARAWDAPSWVADPRLAAELLGWRPAVALEDGLARCWAALGAGGAP
jgi:nucleoside-diphosphate-sugar epimerase